MSLINIEEYDDFPGAYQALGYEMLDQDATDEEIVETLKEIIDEFMVTRTEPDEEDNRGHSRVVPNGNADTRAKKVVEMGWKKWAPYIMSYVKKFYMEDLEETQEATINDFEEQLLEEMSHGVFGWTSDEDQWEEPSLEKDDPLLAQLKGAIESADNSR